MGSFEIIDENCTVSHHYNSILVFSIIIDVVTPDKRGNASSRTSGNDDLICFKETIFLIQNAEMS